VFNSFGTVYNDYIVRPSLSLDYEKREYKVVISTQSWSFNWSKTIKIGQDDTWEQIKIRIDNSIYDLNQEKLKN
jgi:hypothetical protein